MMALYFALWKFEAWRNVPLYLAIIVGGVPMLWQIIGKVIKRDFGADLLAAIALITAVILQENLAANLIILMLSGGHALEEIASRKASKVLEALASRMPSSIHRRTPKGLEEVPLSALNLGDEVVVHPHDTCPVDGVVLEGHGSMDESYLTGEPYHISKAPGASVLSGAINGEAMLVVRAEKLPEDSRYARIMQVMVDAEQKRPKLRRLGDQIGAVFAPLALLFAIAAWAFTGDATRFLAVLVVATPCPLLIAIPITIISAISLAASRGIIIKDPSVLERLPTCSTAIFDKTGTLTYGKPELVSIVTHEGIEESRILQYVASLERYSKHPLAVAIVQAAERRGIALLHVAELSEKPGQGLTGRVDRHLLQITNRRKLVEAKPEAEAWLPPIFAGLEFSVLLDGAYAATFQLRDTPRIDGEPFITHLGPAHRFNKVMLVSGDRESEVAYLANIMGITETYASQTPEQKLVIVRREAASAPTLYMGDGINDAPALTAATVGLAFGSANDITSEAAGAVVLDNTLEKVDELIHISHTMRKIAMQSALGGMAVSLIGMGFAAAGYISPVMGAVLQEVIDVLAILNALRLSWQHIETDM
jgi:heavy metal translocating P-type ATPase